MTRPLLVTFSGLDGSGKTTLIARLASDLRARGRRVSVLTMYDDVSLYSYLRRARDLLRGRSRRGGAPAAPPPNGGPLYSLVRSAPAHRIAFFGDLASLFARRLYHGRRGDQVLILDRYLYDTLADSMAGGWPALATLLRLVPVPDVPILVDVEPESAFARKGEYDVASLARRRDAYAALFARVRHAVIVRNDDLATAAAVVREAVLARSR